MKRNYWPLFFIGIFSFTFVMIVWTIVSAIKTPVNEDETFLKKYHDLDRDFNKVIASNKEFESKYDFNIKINSRDFGLIIDDMFLSQRVLEKKSEHKDIFLNAKNSILITIKDKSTNQIIDDVKIAFRVSRPTNHNNTMDFTNKDFRPVDKKRTRLLEFDLPLKGNWNITATFTIGDDVGYFYIKSNAI